jgi:hypothetical protein
MAQYIGATFVLALVLSAAVTTAQRPQGPTDFRRYIVIPTLPSSLKGVFEIYSLRPDGSFTFGQDNENTPRDSGTYQVRGQEVIFRSTRRGEVVGRLSPDGRALSIQGNTYEMSP